jgi:outer membrane protein assembly factor BamB
VLPEDLSLAVAAQAYDPAASTLYALPPKQAGANAQTLTAINVRTGATRRGAAYQADDLSLADGRLWIYDGAGQRPRVDEVAPGTLATVRAISLPSGQAPFGTAGPAVVTGTDGSVWLGTRQTLLRVSASTGAVLTTVTLPAGLAVATMAAGPDGRYLYVAAAHEVGGSAVEGAVILEYSASAGVLLATQDGAPISSAIAGATLTAVPDGVWASFRTGMLGQSVLLSGRGLAVVKAAAQAGAPTSAYYWAMSSSSAYGGGTLWVTASDGSLVACLNPATGQVIAQETIKSQLAQLRTLLIADPKTRELYGTDLDGTFAALVRITPPAACWG